jgi:RNA polymerase sigma factor (sigma-70 family)
LETMSMSPSDSDCLATFIRAADEAAFATLVHRHGPLALHTALSILRDRQLAEDVAQAVFLILARNARSLNGRPCLAPWVYRVAQRLASNQKRSHALRQRRESEAAARLYDHPGSPMEPDIDAALIHEELAALPESYRTPLVLCYLQGHSGDIAARALALSPQALRKRLERAREMLRARLLRRGLGTGPAAAALTTMLAGHSPAAVLAPKLVSAITRAATTGTAAPTVLKLAASVSPNTATSLLPALCQLILLMKTKTILTAAACAALLVPAAMLWHDPSQASKEHQQAETRNLETQSREMNKRSGKRPRTRQLDGPQDPWLSIRSLTPEEAARIIREKEGQPSLSDYMREPAKMRALLAEMGYNQNQIGALMRMLEDFKPKSKLGSALSPSLRDLPPSLYAVLNRCSDYLFLPGLSTLDAATAKALVSGKFDDGFVLSLSGLSILDADTASALASGEWEKGLHLPGLNTLDAATATALVSGMVDYLDLGGLSTLDAATATALGSGNLEKLNLPGLSILDAATAKALASGNLEELDLSGLRSLDAEATRELAKGTIVRTGGSSRRDAGLQILQLSGLESLDAATAQALADGEVQSLFLSGLRTLDTDAAKALGAKSDWQRLDLRSLRSLDAATATALKGQGNYIGLLNLSGLESLDAATATALVTKGTSFFLDLSGVRSLDVATATALAAGSATLDLSGLTSLDRDVAQALSNRRLGDRMVLDGLTTLDAETAKALMSGPGGKGGYWLNGLRSLDAATATALVASGAPSMLLLDGLESLDADTAAALTSGPYEANRMRMVSLEGLDSLEPAAAEAFSKALDCRRCHADVPTPTLGGCRGGIPEISLSIGVR